MKIAYFVHDLTDAAVHKRVRMLRAGGADIALIGFHRTKEPPADIHGVPAVALGQTFDSDFAHRVRAVALNGAKIGRLRSFFEGADVILARNLEMLALAAWGRRIAAPRARLVYECLDIHPAMVGDGARSQALRAVERALLRRCQLLIVSSPAFVDSYFKPLQNISTPVVLLENKALALTPEELALKPQPGPRDQPGPPWRIGWYGIIRAQKALDILTGIAASDPALTKIIIRGKPSLVDFHDFHGQIAKTPNVSFEGAYSVADLPRLYADVHFNWAFDFIDEERNSTWLLPNRIYEGGRFHAIPMAKRGTQTGRWLADHGVGVLFDDPATEIGPFLSRLTQQDYTGLRQAAAALPSGAVVASDSDCRTLVTALVQ